MIKALIFDFDGLILETEISAYQSWQEIYQEYQRSLPLEEWVKCIGGSADLFDAHTYLENLLGYPLPRETLTEKRIQLRQAILHAQSALPGVVDYLEAARERGLQLAVASSSPRSWVAGHLERLGLLTYFEGLCCGDEVTRTKPDPELYLNALKCLDVQAEEAIALEDSPNGVLAAQRAGIFCVAVPNELTIQLPLDHANMLMPSLAALPLSDLLAAVERRQGEESSPAFNLHT